MIQNHSTVTSLCRLPFLADFIVTADKYCYLRYLNWLKVKNKPYQKFDYLKDNTKFNKTAKDESFIPIRSGENEGSIWLLCVLFSFDLWNLKRYDRVLTAMLRSLKFEHAIIKLACSRRSDSGARAKNIASERAGKNEGRLGKRTRERLWNQF